MTSLCVGLAHSTLARDRDEDIDPEGLIDPNRWDWDKEKKPPADPDFAAPPYPDKKNLIKVRTGNTTTLTMYLDRSSVTVKDGVTRVVYVLESKQGARNVFAEGFRCRDKRYVTYATGTMDGQMIPIKERQWSRVPDYRRNNYRSLLIKYYLCDYFWINRDRNAFIGQVRFPEEFPDSEDF